MTTFVDVDRWRELARQPLPVKALEDFQEDYFGEMRHQYYRFFYHMVKELGPAIALEIGVHHCHCMIHMAYGNRDTLAVGMDFNMIYARPGFDKYAPQNAKLLNTDSLSFEAEMAISNLVEIYGKIGVVFQDSSHHYEASHKEFEVYSKYLAPGAIWCCDDIMDVFHDPLIDPPGKSMLTYFHELPGDKKLYPGLHHGSVIGVLLT